jgi:hypothetical protein
MLADHQRIWGVGVEGQEGAVEAGIFVRLCDGRDVVRVDDRPAARDYFRGIVVADKTDELDRRLVPFSDLRALQAAKTRQPGLAPALFGGGGWSSRAKIEATFDRLRLLEAVEDRTELFNIVAEGLDLRGKGRTGDPHEVSDVLRIERCGLITWATNPRIDGPLDGFDGNLERRGLNEIRMVQAGREAAEHQFRRAWPEVVPGEIRW